MLARFILPALCDEDGAHHCVGRLLVCPHLVVSRFTVLPLGIGGGLPSLIVALPWSFRCFLDHRIHLLISEDGCLLWLLHSLELFIVFLTTEYISWYRRMAAFFDCGTPLIFLLFSCHRIRLFVSKEGCDLWLLHSFDLFVVFFTTEYISWYRRMDAFFDCGTPLIFYRFLDHKIHLLVSEEGCDLWLWHPLNLFVVFLTTEYISWYRRRAAIFDCGTPLIFSLFSWPQNTSNVCWLIPM